MDEFVAWLSERSRASDRIRYRTREPAREPDWCPVSVHPRIERALDSQGIEECYRHQAEAIETVRDGENVVIATPTASGKSLAYTIPAIERALERGARTLYLAPMRALINDQEATLSSFVGALGFGPRVEVEQYTGQKTQHEKRKIRAAEPQVVLTTPDMLHVGILPHSYRLWEWFFRSLDLIVIDEVHEYRGIFGSHVALVLRRLARICERFDAAPQFVCCSATIGNPVEHASTVTGEPLESFSLIEDDTSAAGPRDWVFWNPPAKAKTGAKESDRGKLAIRANGGENTAPAGSSPSVGGERRSSHQETATLFCDLIERGYQVLAFTTARQTAERYARRSASMLERRGEPDLAKKVTAYQAALTRERRETIEGRIQNGSLRGVWSTNALELGIDVGGLDVVLLDGYPGTRMETYQRAGRAGRGTDPSLVVLVGGRDQLDQYLMANPEAFFEKPPERAVLNPENEELLPDHVRCAAVENWLSPEDDAHFGDTLPPLVAELEEAGDLERRTARPGIRWTYAGGDSPHRSVSLRTIDDREVRLVDRARDRKIASLSFADALRDAHPGAIYYHQGRTYEVLDLDVDRGRAELEETSAIHYTRPLREKEITVEEDLAETVLESHSNLPVSLATVTLRERIDGYVRYDRPGDDGTRITFPEPLPETRMRTQSLYFPIPDAVERTIKARAEHQDGFPGAIHAVEHGMISLFPLQLLCDRRDVGGLSTTFHPHTGHSTIFVHDGHPGGVGLARGGFESVSELLSETRTMLAGCPCEDGCPACVQSPHCGNANSPLSKALAVALLEELESGGT